MKTHTEDAFEQFIVEHLVLHGGYEPRGRTTFDPAEALAKHVDYDVQRALIPSELFAFIEATQPKPWAKLRNIHHAKLESLFLDALGKEIEQLGILPVLRNGFKFYGTRVYLAYFRPGHGLNPEVWTLYDRNRLRAVRQLRYDPNSDNELDLAIFLNGLPVLTAELKNEMTGQTAEDAKWQFMRERDPNAPLFRFKRRALVHFAVDTSVAWMTTELRGKGTRFFPFNQGRGHGAGNPPAPEGKHRTHYLWESIWQRDSLIDLVGSFIHLQVEGHRDPDTGRKQVTEAMIFPRFHQIDCVRRLVAAARASGAGRNYLVQHSAGSGKSNTIAWLAHRLASLHDAQERKVYDSVVVLTDRRVLDQQLQNTIYQFDHKAGVVERIDKHSSQLAEALQAGAPIIISTIHKFGFIQDKIEALPDRRYAIIVDEAHSSQSGEMAVTVKELLADSAVQARLEQMIGEEDLAQPDQAAMRAALARGPLGNLSFFAFTATPKFKTLELFGHEGPDGKPAPFHLYSMRQAIEERYILDVLKGYTTYRRFFQLAKAVADDPELDKRKAASALARFVNLHPTNIAQKTQIIIEHFRSCVMGELEGRAKAMVIASSRLMAVKYKQAFDAYIREKGYRDLRCLVAFSGEVRDDVGEAFAEVGMNGGIKETEVPERFASSAFQVLIVAEKYQTGFDQPLLCAMYVDDKLSGIRAVQTLSRLNRTTRGKERTFVLDFVNERETILAAFQDYYEATEIDERVDPQRLYELRNELNGFQLYTPSEVDGFAALFFKLPADKKLADHPKLKSWLEPAVDRFKALMSGEDDEEGRQRQEQFRGRLNAFINLYGFLGQIVPFQDVDLEKLYAFARLLRRTLPRTEGGGLLALDDEVALASFRLKREQEADLALQKDQVRELAGPFATGTGGAKEAHERLSTIIDLINERFGTHFDAQDLVAGVTDQLVQDEGLQQAARVNDRGNFAVPFREALDDALVTRHGKHGDFINQVFEDEALGGFFRAWMLDKVYGALRGGEARVR